MHIDFTRSVKEDSLQTSKKRKVQGPNHIQLEAWSSLIEGRRVISGGVVWSVGDGRTIRPFMDAWLPGRYDIRLGTRLVSQAQAGTILAEWIDQETKEWKKADVRAALNNT